MLFRRTCWRPATLLFIFGVSLTLSACGGNSLHIAPPALSASSVLTKAQHASLSSAHFTFSFTVHDATTSPQNQQSSPQANYSTTGQGVIRFGLTPAMMMQYHTTVDQQQITLDMVGSTMGTWVQSAGVNASWVQVSHDPSPLTEMINYSHLQPTTSVQQETLNGSQAYHLSGHLPPPSTLPSSAPAAHQDAQEDIWFRVGTLYPAKIVLTTQDPTATQRAQITFAFAQWNESVSIPQPSPVASPETTPAPGLSDSHLITASTPLWSRSPLKPLVPRRSLACTPQPKVGWSWGVFYIYLDHCGVLLVSSVLQGYSSAIGIAALGCIGPQSVVCGAIALSLGLYIWIEAQALAAADSGCNNAGAYLNIWPYVPWFFPPIMWVRANC